MVRTNSQCKGELVVHVQQKFPLLYPYFYPCPIALWTTLQLENMSIIEMNTDWKSLNFHGPEKAIKLAKSKITKIEENLTETAKHCQK